MKRSNSHRQRIGPAVRRMRLQQGMTLDDLAAAAGVSPSHLSRLERSQTLPSFPVLAKIAAALGTNVNDFVRLEHDVTVMDAQLERYFDILGIDREQRAEFMRLSIEARRTLLKSLRALSDFEPAPPETQDSLVQQVVELGGLPGLAAAREVILDAGMTATIYSRALMRVEQSLGNRSLLVGNVSLLPIAPGNDLVAAYRRACGPEPIDPAAAKWWQSPHPDGAQRGGELRPVRAIVGRRALESPIGAMIATSLLHVLDRDAAEIAVTERELGPVNMVVIDETYVLLEDLQPNIADGSHRIALWMAGQHRAAPLQRVIDDIWDGLAPDEKAPERTADQLNGYLESGEPPGGGLRVQPAPVMTADDAIDLD